MARRTMPVPAPQPGVPPEPQSGRRLRRDPRTCSAPRLRGRRWHCCRRARSNRGRCRTPSRTLPRSCRCSSQACSPPVSWRASPAWTRDAPPGASSPPDPRSNVRPAPPGRRERRVRSPPAPRDPSSRARSLGSGRSRPPGEGRRARPRAGVLRRPSGGRRRGCAARTVRPRSRRSAGSPPRCTPRSASSPAPRRRRSSRHGNRTGAQAASRRSRAHRPPPAGPGSPPGRASPPAPPRQPRSPACADRG